MKSYSSKKNKNITNIKIFTFFYTNNYTALLQALSLKEFLTTSFNLEVDKKPIPCIESSKFFLCNCLKEKSIIILIY